MSGLSVSKMWSISRLWPGRRLGSWVRLFAIELARRHRLIDPSFARQADARIGALSTPTYLK